MKIGETVLAEASQLDKIWGIGMTADDPDARCSENNWNGENILGSKLMELRQKC